MKKIKIKDLKVGDVIYSKSGGTLEAVKEIDPEEKFIKAFILQFDDDETFEPNLVETYFTYEEDDLYLMVG